MSESPLPRSPYDAVEGLFHFGRMLDKARLAAKGTLPEGYQAQLGEGFDGRLSRYLGVPYARIADWAEASEDDAAVATRCFAEGRELDDEAKFIWNSYVSKRGWRDDGTAGFIPEMIRRNGIDDDGSLQTGFDFIERDEGRPIDGWRTAWTPEIPATPYPASIGRLADVFRHHATPLDPLPTGETPEIAPLPGIRAVVFDIYGTLIISGSGDISLAEKEDRSTALRVALETAGIAPLPPEIGLDRRFHAAIHRAQDTRRGEGITYPEVEIREVWTEFLADLAADGFEFSRPTPDALEILAIEYECRVNPVWPMPHLAEILAHLAGNGLTLGIVSNAQFYTRLMFPAFLGQPLAALGFSLDCNVFSYEEREGKPSTALYEKLVQRLARRGIAAHETLYVGNDLRNDIWPAQAVGLRTALFAGDARSLRWREDDERVKGVRPDRLVTDLYQLRAILSDAS